MHNLQNNRDYRDVMTWISSIVTHSLAIFPREAIDLAAFETSVPMG